MTITINGSGPITGSDRAELGINTDITSLGSVASITGGQLAGFRNRIINGDMRIDQRNGGAAITVNNNTAAAFSVDRWFGYGQPTDGVFTLQQVTDAPAGFAYSLKATVTTVDASIAAAQIYKIEHRVEGFNVVDLGAGTSAAKPVVVSFWVKSSIAGVHSCTLGNNIDLSYACAYTINVANTWEYKTFTCQLPTTGTWSKSTGVGMMVTFPLGVGSTNKGAANTWANYIVQATGTVELISTLNATFQVTGVQLELGSVATPFEQRPYGLELALCQRYCLAIPMNIFFGTGTVRTGGTTHYILVPVPTEMRATPTISGPFSTIYVGDSLAVLTAWSSISCGSNTLWLQVNTSSVGSVGQAALIYSSAGPVLLSAEL